MLKRVIVQTLKPVQSETGNLNGHLWSYTPWEQGDRRTVGFTPSDAAQNVAAGKAVVEKNFPLTLADAWAFLRNKPIPSKQLWRDADVPRPRVSSRGGSPKPG